MTTQTEGLPVALDAPVIERHCTYAWLPKQHGRIVCVAHDWVIVRWDDGVRERVPRSEIGHDDTALVEVMPNE